jgi:hypothetical protein
MVEYGSAFNGLEWPGKTADQDFWINMTNVQYDWTTTTGVRLAEGRDFSPAYGSDTAGCLINQAAALKMNLKEPIVGTRLSNHPVIGVVQNFVYNDPAGPSKPLIVYLSKGSLSHFLLRLSNDGAWQSRLDQIGKVAKNLNPAYPFEYRFTDNNYQEKFKKASCLRQLINILGGLAMFIPCLGLFGLAGFLVERQRKEIGIRKVLGASATRLWFSLTREFLWPVLLAFVLAAPLAGFLMQKMLSTMDYHISLAWWMFALAGVTALLVAMGTVSYHSIRAALANPARTLQTE